MFHPWSHSLVILASSLHRIFLKSFPSHLSVNPHCRHLPCHQVLKRGIVYDSPIHAFFLDPPSSPKHFGRIASVVNLCSHRRPGYSFSGFNSCIQSHLPHRSQTSSFDLSHHATSSIQNPRKLRFFFPILALLWNPGKNWLSQRRDAGAQTGDRGVLGKEGMQS
jgi:hypothetical protein